LRERRNQKNNICKPRRAAGQRDHCLHWQHALRLPAPGNLWQLDNFAEIGL
jgi:hypothetical protein